MTTSVDTDLGVLAEAAARAAAELLPAAAPLTLGAPLSSAAELALPGGTAVVARFSGARSGRVLVVVDENVVAALRDSPMGQLDLAAALHPALEAAAAALGPCTVEAGRELALDELGVGAAGGCLVPLVSQDVVQAAVGLVLEVGPDSPRVGGVTGSGLDMLRHVELDVTAELGRTRMAMRELLSMAPGAVIELDRAAGSPADLLVNGKLIARGEVVVIDEHYGIRITEIVATTQGRA